MQIIDTIPTGSRSGAIAVLPDQSRAYVVNAGDNICCDNDHVLVIDTQQRTVIATMEVERGALSLAISPDGKLAYVVNSFSDSVSVIDTVRNQVVNTVFVGSVPSGLAFTPDGMRAYVTNSGSDPFGGISPSVSVIDVARAQVITTIPMAGGFGIAASPSGHFVYVSQGAIALVVIATDTNKVVDSIPFNFIDTITISPDGSRIYAPQGIEVGPSTLYVIDAVSHLVVATLQTEEPGLALMVPTPDGKQAFLGFATNTSHGIQTLDTKTLKFTSGVTHLPIQLGGMALVNKH
jgi:YVTN family beta-propeller protein